MCVREEGNVVGRLGVVGKVKKMKRKRKKVKKEVRGSKRTNEPTYQRTNERASERTKEVQLVYLISNQIKFYSILFDSFLPSENMYITYYLYIHTYLLTYIQLTYHSYHAFFVSSILLFLISCSFVRSG